KLLHERVDLRGALVLAEPVGSWSTTRGAHLNFPLPRTQVWRAERPHTGWPIRGRAMATSQGLLWSSVWPWLRATVGSVVSRRVPAGWRAGRGGAGTGVVVGDVGEDLGGCVAGAVGGGDEQCGFVVDPAGDVGHGAFGGVEAVGGHDRVSDGLCLGFHLDEA